MLPLLERHAGRCCSISLSARCKILDGKNTCTSSSPRLRRLYAENLRHIRCRPVNTRWNDMNFNVKIYYISEIIYIYDRRLYLYVCFNYTFQSRISSFTIESSRFLPKAISAKIATRFSRKHHKLLIDIQLS